MVVRMQRRTWNLALEKLPPAERGPEYWAARRSVGGHDWQILPVEPDLNAQLLQEAWNNYEREKNLPVTSD